MNKSPENPNKVWYLIGPSRKMSKPYASTVQSRRLVFFLSNGAVCALDDRCLHRQVSLSRGQVRDGQLACPYHGARYNGLGECVHVPSLVEGQSPPPCRVNSYKTHIDERGLVWVNLGSNPEPFKTGFPPPHRGQRSLHFDYTIKAPALFIIENFVDCAHTGFVHRGLFRGEPQQIVSVQVHTKGTMVEIATIGENDSQSVLAKLFNPKKKPTRHIDRYIAPYTVNVLYQMGPLEIETISVCTPIETNETQVNTYVLLRGRRWLSLLLKPVLYFYVRKILKQDVEILEDQTRQAERTDRRPPLFFATDKAILRVMKAYENFHDDVVTQDSSTTFEMRL